MGKDTTTITMRKKIFIGVLFFGIMGAIVTHAAFPTSYTSWVSGNVITSAWMNAIEQKLGIDGSATSTSLTNQVNSKSSQISGMSTSSAISLTAGSGISISTTSNSVTISASGLTFTTTTINGLSATTYTFSQGAAGIVITTSSSGTVTFQNSGVTSLAGSGSVAVNNSTGSVTVSFNGGFSTTTISGLVGTITGNGSAGIVFTTSTGAFTIQNSGLLSLAVGASGLVLSSATGTPTLQFSGVSSLTGSTGLVVSNSTGTITLQNSGVLSVNAGSNITVSTATGTPSIAVTSTPTFGTTTVSGNLTVNKINNIASGTLQRRDKPYNFVAATTSANFTDPIGPFDSTSTIEGVWLAVQNSSDSLTINFFYTATSSINVATSTMFPLFTNYITFSNTTTTFFAITASSTPKASSTLVVDVRNTSTSYFLSKTNYHENQ